MMFKENTIPTSLDLLSGTATSPSEVHLQKCIQLEGKMAFTIAISLIGTAAKDTVDIFRYTVNILHLVDLHKLISQIG